MGDAFSQNLNSWQMSLKRHLVELVLAPDIGAWRFQARWKGIALHSSAS